MYSIIFGTLASVLPNLLFAWLYFRSTVNRPVQFMRLVYLYEGLKFAILAAVFSVCLRWPDLQVTKFFTAFLLCELFRFVFIKYKLARKIK